MHRRVWRFVGGAGATGFAGVVGYGGIRVVRGLRVSCRGGGNV